MSSMRLEVSRRSSDKMRSVVMCVSTILWLGFMALCVRSYWQYDRILWSSVRPTPTGWRATSDTARSIHGILVWDRSTASFWPGTQPDPALRPIQWIHVPIANVRATSYGDAPPIRWLGLGRKRVSGANAAYAYVSHSLLIPFWLPLLLTGALPASAVLSRLRQHFRWRHNADRCLSCGYDLTSNASGICPECGTAIALSSNRIVSRGSV
jgi:hypothetical protein